VCVSDGRVMQNTTRGIYLAVNWCDYFHVHGKEKPLVNEIVNFFIQNREESIVIQ